MDFKTVGTFSLAGTMLLAGATYYVVCGCTILAPQPPPPPVSLCDPGNTFDPCHPEASGYQIAFEDHFPSLAALDNNNTGNFGYHWYRLQPFGFTPPPATDFTLDSGGGLVQTPTSLAVTNTIQTAYPNANATNGEKWVGTSFGPGYFEATFAFDGPGVNTNNGWPAWWAMAVEHWANVGGDQWPGQVAGFTHYIEDDFFEYDNI